MKEFLETHESLSWTLIIISIIVLIMGCILLAALAVYLYELMKDKFHILKEDRNRQQNKNNDHRLLFLSKEIESVKKQQLVLAGAITTRKPKESEDSKPEIKRGRGRPKKQ